jgi:G3E family GTPase
VGCSLAARLVALQKELKRKHNPDFLFIEPSEMVVTQELRDVMAMGRRDITYEIGPLITLVNGPEFDSQWQNRSFLMIGQMKDADLVLLSRSDLMDACGIHALEQKLMDYVRSLLPLSVPCNRGVKEVVMAVLG